MDTWKEFDQNVITHSAAHHLMAIDDLVNKFGYARVSDVARLLNITRGSVSISLQPLKKNGLVCQDENRHLRLSDDGQALVNAIKTKRLLLRRLFAEILGVDSASAEVDACKIEHLIGNPTARQLVALFRFLDAHPPSAREFLAALQSQVHDCPHAPQECPTCQDQCLSERLEAN